MQKIQILKFWECPLYEIWEYVFKYELVWKMLKLIGLLYIVYCIFQN